MKIERLFKDGNVEYHHHEFLEAIGVQDLLSKAGKIIKFKGSIWSWLLYDESNDPSIDYILTYVPASQNEIDLGIDREIDDHYYGIKKIGFGCECGAEKTGQPGHSQWCTKFKNL
jgi:hypothetical protein